MLHLCYIYVTSKSLLPGYVLTVIFTKQLQRHITVRLLQNVTVYEVSWVYLWLYMYIQHIWVEKHKKLA